MFELIIKHVNLTEMVLMGLTTLFGAFAVWYRRKLTEWAKFWRAVLEGLKKIPQLETKMMGIAKYVAPNGGGSLADSVHRTEAAVGVLTSHVDLLASTIEAERDFDDTGRFHCNPDGANTYVNAAYARMLGVGKSDLLGWNYLNYVAPEDEDTVQQHWSECRAAHRIYRMRHHMTTATGARIEVDVLATPSPQNPPAKHWVGFIRRTEFGNLAGD